MKWQIHRNAGFTSWIYCFIWLCAFWGCDIYRQECHHMTFGMLANLWLCSIKEGAVSSYTSLVTALILKFPVLLQSWLFIAAPVQLFTPSRAETMLWPVSMMGKNTKPPYLLKRKIRERKKGINDEVLIVHFQLLFNELFASLKSM